MKIFRGKEEGLSLKLLSCIVVITLSLAFLIFPGTGFAAGPDVWTNLGIYGGQVLSIAIDPVNPDKMFAGTDQVDGLYVTTDGGANWQPVAMNGDIPGEAQFNNHVILDIKIAPSDSNVVWVAHNYWVARSLDGGHTWTHITNSIMQRDCTACGGDGDNFRFCYSLAIDPADPDTVYVGTSGANSTYTEGAIYKTMDGGVSWTKLNHGDNFDYTITDMDIDSQNPIAVYAVTNYTGSPSWGGALYHSIDGGENWDTITSLTSSQGTFYAVAVKQNDGNTVFTSSWFGIHKHTFSNEEWTTDYYVMENCWFAKDISFAPSNPEVVYAVWMFPSRVGGDDIPRISKSEDGGNTWTTQILNINPHYPNITLEVHPKNSDAVIIGHPSLALLQSMDSGQSWTQTINGIKAIITFDVASDPAGGGHLLVGTNAGVYERKNAEAEWELLISEITHCITFHPTDSRTFYAGGEQYLNKSMDGGRTWTRSNLLTNGYIKIRDIAVDASVDPATLFIATEDMNGNLSNIYKSTDNGGTFHIIMDGENLDGAPCAFNAVAIDPSDPTHLFAGSGNFYDAVIKGDLWESRDSGDTWHRTALTNIIVNDIVFNPDQPDIVYVGCGHSAGTDISLYKSVDGGMSWQPSMTGLPGKVDWHFQIWGDNNGELFIAGGRAWLMPYNMYHYDGKNWSPMDTPPISESLRGIWGVSVDDVFAVGHAGVILHFDGRSWTQMESHTTENLTGILGFSSSDIYVVGENATLLHYDDDGTSWSVTQLSYDLKKIWGVDANSIFGVGSEGAILYYNGTSWNKMNSGTNQDLYDIWGTSPDNIYVVGQGGVILHYDGSAWAEIMRSDVSMHDLLSIWGSGADDVYAVGRSGSIFHYNGTAWRSVNTELNLWAEQPYWDVWGTSSSDVYIIGELGSVLHFDGSTWKSLKATGRNQNAVTDLAFHRQNKNILYAATYETGVYISPNSGDNWLNLGEPDYSVYAISAGSLYAATQGGLYQCTGTGVIAGRVTDAVSNYNIDGGVVMTDLGTRSLTIDGDYMMISPAGIFDVFALNQDHDAASFSNIPVLGAEVSWVNFSMNIKSSSDTTHETIEKNTLPASLRSFIDSPAGSAVEGGQYCFIGMMIDKKENRSVTSFFSAIGICMVIAVICLLYFAKSRICGLLLMLIFLPCASHAATIFEQVGISSTPSPVGSGARALGMGGAFIATADDATAASWNPAGLIQLEKPEVSIVGAGLSESMKFSSDEHPEINNTGNIDDANLNYFSAAYPFHYRKNIVISLNYQRLYEFKRKFTYQRNYQDEGLNLAEHIELNQDGFLGALGFAGAVEITPRLSLGITVNIWTDELFWENSWTETYHNNAVSMVNNVAIMDDTHIQDIYSEFRGLNANLGVLWNLCDELSVGAVVKTPFTGTMKHEFSYQNTKTYGPPINSTDPVSLTYTEDVALTMPLSYGMGCAYRFLDTAGIDLDVYRTHWQDYVLENSRGEKFSPIDGRPAHLSNVKDTTHVRLGGEYLVVFHEKKMILSLKSGIFMDPEPSENDVKAFYGAALGTGLVYKRCMFDVAYQFRWANDADTGNLIDDSHADIRQHQILYSLIVFL